LSESDPDAVTLTWASKSIGSITPIFNPRIGVSRAMENKDRIDMSNEGITNYYAYLGPLGEVVRHGLLFFASKDGFLIGTYASLGEAMESLAWKGRVKLL